MKPGKVVNGRCRTAVTKLCRTRSLGVPPVFDNFVKRNKCKHCGLAKFSLELEFEGTKNSLPLGRKIKSPDGPINS